MKYKQILIIISIVLIGIHRNVYSQSSNNINSINIQTDTLYDLERNYKPLPNGFDINTNLDSLEFTERRIPKVRRIFKAGKTYHYKAIYLSSKNDTLSNSYVNMETTGLRRPDADSEKQDLVYYLFPNYKADSIKLSNHFINKEYQNWTGKNGQGIIENIENVWIHPIQSNQYKFTEVAPFPEANLPLQKGKKWEGTTTGIIGWGEWDGQTVKSKYKISGQEIYLLGDLKIDCWVIKSVARCSSGKSKLTTLFNEEYGFVKMEYQNYEKEKLVFELIKMEEK